MWVTTLRASAKRKGFRAGNAGNPSGFAAFFFPKFRHENVSTISKTQQAQGLLISIKLFRPPIGAKLHTH
jgi:hypothetical protein